MTSYHTTYDDAVRRLDHVERVKRALCELLDRLTDVSHSGMLIRARDYDNAVSGIQEIIDELFHEEVFSARRAREIAEQQDWYRAIQELSTIP